MNGNDERMDKMFAITSVCRADIEHAIEDTEELKDLDPYEFAKSLTDTEMEWIARKLSDGFLDCCYWMTIRHLVERIESDRVKR